MAPTKRTKTTKRLSLSIGVWNVNGLVSKDFDKLNDVSCLNCIKNLDIVGLVETHTTSSFISPLVDYKIFHTHRVQNNRAKRKFGGISVLIRKSLSDGVEPLPVTNSSIVWFKLKSKFFNTSKDICMCFFYIYPQKTPPILDFNARTASDPDVIQYDNNDKFIQNDSNYIYDLVNFCRISTDVTTCNRGKRLLEICSQSQLRIANGRSFGDLTGEFTSHSTLCSSVIDYFVISEAILGKLLFMKVHDFMKSLSDHCLNSCVLSVNFTDTHCHENTNYIPKPLKYIWKDKSIQSFQDALSLPSVTQKVTKYLDVDYSCKYSCSLVDSDNYYWKTSCKINQAVSDFSDITLSTANTSLKARTPQRRNNHNNKCENWYD